MQLVKSVYLGLLFLRVRVHDGRAEKDMAAGTEKDSPLKSTGKGRRRYSGNGASLLETSSPSPVTRLLQQSYTS